jgi:hypothetical protein
MLDAGELEKVSIHRLADHRLMDQLPCCAKHSCRAYSLYKKDHFKVEVVWCSDPIYSASDSINFGKEPPAPLVIFQF